MAYTMQQRRDTAANWTSANPTLVSGEIGFETDTGRFKIGNGSTVWNSLAYEDSQPANPTATIGLSATNGSAATFMRSDGAPALSQAIAPTWTGVHTYTPAARSSGAAPYYTINAPADTGITASTESIGISIVGATRTRAAGAVTTQREVVIAAPTYAATSATTITTAATVAIAGPPNAGSNVTITNPRALWVQGGVTQLTPFSYNVTCLQFGSTDTGIASDGLSNVATRINSTQALSVGGNVVAINNSWQIEWSPIPNGVAGNCGLARSANGLIRLTNGGSNSGAAGLCSNANSPAQIAANTNDYSPSVGMYQRWSSDASRNVTGMVAGVDGEIRYVWNVGAQNIVLTHQDAASTAANRWLSSTGANLTLAPDKCALCMYDATTQRWRVTLLP